MNMMTDHKNVRDGRDGRVASHQRPQQHSIRAERQQRLGRRATLETDLVSDRLPDLLTSLRSDALGHAHRTQTAWLRAEDATRLTALVAVVEDELRNLKKHKLVQIKDWISIFIKAKDSYIFR